MITFNLESTAQGIKNIPVTFGPQVTSTLKVSVRFASVRVSVRFLARGRDPRSADGFLLSTLASEIVSWSIGFTVTD